MVCCFDFLVLFGVLVFCWFVVCFFFMLLVVNSVLWIVMCIFMRILLGLHSIGQVVGYDLDAAVIVLVGGGCYGGR